MSDVTVTLGAKDEGLSNSLAGITKSINDVSSKGVDAAKNFDISFGKIGIAAGVAGAAVKVGMMAVELATATATKTIASFGSALDMGGRLNDLADRTGIAVDKVMLLERAFQNSGVGADSLGPIINKMQKAIVDAGDGTSGAAVAFANLGLSLSEISALTPEEQLRTIGKAIAGVEDPAMRASLSMEIFGKSGGALNQVFANFDGEIQTAKNQLGSLPDIMKAGSSQFDRISDNLVVVGGKFIEFAAGIIDRVKPALDAITTGLSMIDAAKIGQELGDFFVGAGSGMKMFQASIDAFSTGNLTDGFKLAWQAIVTQAMDTANSIWTYMVAAFKTVGDFIRDQFDSKGPLAMVITSTFDFVAGYIKKVVAGTLFETFTNMGPAFSRIAEGLKQSSEAGALSAELALQRIPVATELAAEKASDSMGNIPEQFKANMAGVKPLFDTVTQKQDEIVGKNSEIGKSLDEAWGKLPRPENFVEISKAQQDEIDKSTLLADKKAAEDERAANAEKARQEKLKESAALKREEIDLQIQISNAIAAGNTKQAEALKGAKDLKNTIQELIKSGMGESEATKLANEMARAAREADRVKNSLATKIDEKIKSKEDSDAIDKGGALQKRADEQIAAGQYNAARATGQQLAMRELEASVRGTGAGSDRRSEQDIARDYFGPDWTTKGRKETLEAIRKARDEGIYPGQDEMKKASTPSLDKMKPSSDKPGQSGTQDKSEKKESKQSLDSIVKDIFELVKKIEPKLPVAALSA